MESVYITRRTKNTRTNLLRAVVNSSKWEAGSMVKILVLGITGAGKTTVIDFLKSGERTPTNRVPTLAFTPYKFDFGRVSLVFVDVPGQEAYWDQWKRYIREADGILFVIDSTNPSLLHPINRLLRRIVKADESGVPIAFIANKQDLPNSLSSKSIASLLGFRNIPGRKISAFDTSALTGKGIVDTIQWIISESYKN